MKLSRIIRPHSKDCRMKDQKTPWSGHLKEGCKNPYWGNHAANPVAKNKHHVWYIVSCNDPSCKGEKAVHSSVLANA